METKLNEGVIFKNENKPEGSKQPDYRGEIDCEGVKKEIALWVRESQAGKKYFSVKLSDPWKPEGKAAGQPVKVTSDSNDDLPF